MITQEQIKNEYAVSRGYSDWDNLIICVFDFNIQAHDEFINHENELMKIYAMECLKNANKNLSLEECGFDGRDYGITNENNIIK